MNALKWMAKTAFWIALIFISIGILVALATG